MKFSAFCSTSQALILSFDSDKHALQSAWGLGSRCPMLGVSQCTTTFVITWYGCRPSQPGFHPRSSIV